MNFNHLPQTNHRTRGLQFDSSKPCLILAPLFEFPIRSGDNILVHNRWSSFSRLVPYVDVVGHNVIVRYENGEIVSKVSYDNSAGGKYTSSLKVILNRSHYLVEKYLTKEFRNEATKYLQNTIYGTVVYCYIWTTAILFELQKTKPILTNNQFQIIETINDEVQWYRNIRKASPNPLAKLTAWLSENWIKRFFSTLSSEFLFVHLTRADYQGYLRYFPNHIGLVAPVGTNIKNDTVIKELTDTSDRVIHLLFVGSLNVQMNFDALIYFEQSFYPVLRQELGDQLEVTIVGKSPTRKIKDLCTKLNWHLFANVTDTQLDDIFRQATFTILPFSYTSGAKLKLLDSVTHGVPFLATNVLAHQVQTAVYPCLFSDDPREWLQRIIEVGPGSTSKEYRVALQEFAQQYSWDALTLTLYNYLEATFHE